jgi:hypothetical protein
MTWSMMLGDKFLIAQQFDLYKTKTSQSVTFLFELLTQTITHEQLVMSEAF